MYSREESIRLMNRWGTENRSFFFFISYDGQQVLLSPLDTPENNLYFDLPGFPRFLPAEQIPPLPANPVFQPTPPSRQEYQRAFDIAQKHLNRGDSYLLNLTFPTSVTTNLSLEQFFHRARAPYKVLYRSEQEQFVCFSPETFVTIQDNIIRTNPMKGTIPADLPEAESRLMQNEKEAREHATIVDLLRNDLAQIACEVEVTRYRYMERITTSRGTLLQTCSEIQGRLPENWHTRPGDLLYTLLPAGSVTGAPKAWTCHAIREAESYDRGFYTGVFGIYASGQLTSAVAIRFLEKDGETCLYKSGGGITTLSNAEEEYKELIEKVYVPFIF